MENIKITLIRAWLFVSLSIVSDDDFDMNYFSEIYEFTRFEKMIGCIATLFLVVTLIVIPIALYYFYWSNFFVSVTTIGLYVCLNIIIIGKSFELLHNLAFCPYLLEDDEDEIQI